MLMVMEEIPWRVQAADARQGCRIGLRGTEAAQVFCANEVLFRIAALGSAAPSQPQVSPLHRPSDPHARLRAITSLARG